MNYAKNIAICNWLLTTFTIGYAGFGCIGGLIQLYWNWSTRNITFVGGTIIVGQYLFTYYYTSSIYVILICSFGTLYGIGCGLSWGPSIVCVIAWFPNNKGLLTGLLLSAVALGSICYSSIETLYINPTNIINDDKCGYSLYPTIINKVPSAFFLLAVFSLIGTLIGSVFLFDKDEDIDNSALEIDKIDIDIDYGSCSDNINNNKI